MLWTTSFRFVAGDPHDFTLGMLTAVATRDLRAILNLFADFLENSCRRARHSWSVHRRSTIATTRCRTCSRLRERPWWSSDARRVHEWGWLRAAADGSLSRPQAGNHTNMKSVASIAAPFMKVMTSWAVPPL